MKRYKDIAGDGGSNIAGQGEAQQGRLRQRLASVRTIVAIVSGKGGVGKSTLTASLACCFAIDGWKIGVLDADLNGPTQAKVLDAARSANLDHGEFNMLARAARRGTGTLNAGTADLLAKGRLADKHGWLTPVPVAAGVGR